MPKEPEEEKLQPESAEDAEEELQAPSEEEEEEDGRFKWYVVHSFSGYEKRVKKYLEGTIVRKYPEKLKEVLIPTEEVTRRTRKGRKSIRQKKLYPGYVFVKLDLTEEIVMDIRAMSNVSGFPPMNKGYPQPLNEDEVKRILGQAEGTEKRKVVRVPFSVGQTVRVVEGPFKNFTGVVESLNPDRGKARVIFTIFGRKAPVEVEFSQVRSV
ncbi:transcription termination/antitermination factor NusG [Candidatus Fermentibacteria bacterium]|nr:transcription termination/antitermination factor NusG [Candidatus Fermentibacteria bacterium]